MKLENKPNIKPRPKDLPEWGIGLECPFEVEEREDIEDLLARVTNVEFICEGMFLGKRDDFLKKLAKAGTPIIGHSVDLSIGTAEPLKQKHVLEIVKILETVNTVVYSDHLCMTEANGVEIGQLTTLPWTQEQADVTCRKIEELQKIVPWPVMLENITNRFIVPGCELTEPEFINHVMSQTGCGLLLDVTNLYTNAQNFKFDPYEWLKELDMKHVMGIHLAGGEWEDGVLYDTHSRPVYNEVWDVFRYVLNHSSPKCVVVEWDQDPPPAHRLLEEVFQAEQIYQETRETHAKLHTKQNSDRPKLKTFAYNQTEPLTAKAMGSEL